MEKSASKNPNIEKNVPNLYVWIIENISKCRVTIHAGHVTFFMLVSFFPFVMFLLTILNLSKVIDLHAVRDQLAALNAGFIIKTIIGWIDDILSSNGGIISVATFLVLIWSGSKGFDGLAQGLDSIYGARGKRGYAKRRLFSMIHLVSFVMMIIVTLFLVVFGSLIIHWLAEELPYLKGVRLLISLIRYLLIAFMFLSFFVLVFRFIPYTPTETIAEKKARRKKNKALPKGKKIKRPLERTLKKELPGALVTSVTWIIFSRLYGIYMSYQLEHASIYGSLTAFFLTLLWLYYSMLFIFVGGLFNYYSYVTGEQSIRHVLKDLPGLVVWIKNKINDTFKPKKNDAA